MISNDTKEGFIIVLSSPSGGGKSSISKALLHHDDKLKLSISTTTRKPRIGEIEAVDYYFKTNDEFDKLITQNMFIEYTKIYDNYYGTLREPLKKSLHCGFDVLFDIDLEGTRSIKNKMPEVVTIFILPPTIEVLRDRLESRGQDCHHTIASRMEHALEEISYAEEYDYVIVNDKFANSITKIQSIIVAERIKRSRSYKLCLFQQ